MLDKTLIHSKHQKLLLAITIIILFVYCYSFFNFQIYCGKNGFIIKRFVCIAVIYISSIALLWWKNDLEKIYNIISSCLAFVITPFLCYFVLEFMQKEWGAFSGDGYSYKIHMLNLAIYGFALIIVFLISGSMKISMIITYAFFILLGILMYYIMEFREIALIAADFFTVKTAVNVAGAYDYNIGFPAYFGISVGMLGIVLACKTKDPFKPDLKLRTIMILSAAILAGCFYGTYFNWDRMEKFKVRLWRPQDSYEEFGSALALTRSIKYMLVEKPEGYSLKEVNRIAEPYIGDGNSKLTENNASVIIIMDEAFADIQNLGINTLNTNKEVMPFTKSLYENTQRGELYVSRIGGGTAIMEFEMLTSNTNAFLPKSTIAYQTLIKEETPSLASQLKDAGYCGVTAMHPYKGNGYYRDKAYPLLGFNEFIDENGFDLSDDKKVIGKRVSDKTVFEKIISEYEHYVSISDKPYFSFSVTMQNHSPYEEVTNPEIVIEDEEFQNETAQSYLNYIHKTDEAFEELIKYFESIEDPVVIVLFGDHPPGIKNGFYDKLNDGDGGDSIEKSMKIRRTPFILWANYDIEEKDLGVLSTNYISNIIIENSGNTKTGYQRFLDEFRKYVPVINELGYIGNDGKFYEIEDKASPYYEKVREYNILEYNCLIDTKNRIDGFFDNES
ncbi:MAG: LTA synthase family protein [Bacillota bacterium]|nr:LTA synthase family protein [Bacillota bacterium]